MVKQVDFMLVKTRRGKNAVVQKHHKRTPRKDRDPSTSNASNTPGSSRLHTPHDPHSPHAIPEFLPSRRKKAGGKVTFCPVQLPFLNNFNRARMNILPIGNISKIVTWSNFYPTKVLLMIRHAPPAKKMMHYIAAWIALATETFADNAVSNITTDSLSIEFATGLENTSNLPACMTWDSF